MLSNWHLSPALSSLLREKKQKGNKILVIYYEFSLVNTACWPAKHSLPSLVLQREGGSGCLAGKATAVRLLPGDYQQPSSQTIPDTSLEGPCKTADGLGNRASSSAPLLSINSRDCHCKKKINNRTFPLSAIHHFRASLEAADTSQTRRRSRPCLPRQNTTFEIW